LPKKIKTVSESKVEMIELVLPNDTNTLGSLLGGRLMHWIDIAAALAAAKHCNNIAVTAEVDNLVFHTPIQLGDIVKLKASVNKTFRSSMEVGVRVEIEDIKSDKITHSNSAYLTFVNIDRKTRIPIPAPKIKPESEEEIRRYEQASKRREQRLKRKHGIVK
jgi:acyl-CoA hydrolase